MIRLVPGDPIEVRRGGAAFLRSVLNCSPRNGPDQPIWKQFLDYVWDLLYGDFCA
jgi:dipeptide transport system permease protein